MGKLITLFAIAFFASTSIHAQISKGSVLLGGGIGYSNYINKDDAGVTIIKQKIFSITPAVGVAIKENLILGGELGFMSQLNESGITSTYKSYGVGVFMRKYIPVANRFYIFGQGRIGANLFDGETTHGSTSDGYNVNVGIYPGVSFQVNKKLHLETGFNNLVYVKYENLKVTSISQGSSSSKESIKSFDVNSSLNNMSGLYVGFRLLLAKKAR